MMNSRERRKKAAEKHNKERAEYLALLKDKEENPEKYKRKRRSKSNIRTGVWMAAAAAFSAPAMDMLNKIK